VIFTAQALIGGAAMATGLEGTARIILVAVIPRSLIAIGIFFSVWFPKWYPQRAAAREGAQRMAGIPDGVSGLQLVEFMPLAFNAEAASDLRATIQFHLRGDGGGAGYLEIESNCCTFHPGEADRPALTIESPADVWSAISQGKMNGAEAFLDGAYTADGDISVLLQLDNLFSSAPETDRLSLVEG